MVVRPYHADDVAGLVDLFARVFDKRITSELWRWKLAAQASPACNVWLAEAEGRPVFQYAGIPQRYELDGIAGTAFVSVDTMTDPEYRRRGLLTQVAAAAYQAWRDAGANFVIGLPNQQWGSRTAALGWRELFPLRWLRRAIEPQELLASRTRLPWLANLPGVARAWNAACDARLRRDPTVQVRELSRAGAEFDAWWRAVRVHYPYAAVRDSAWINWRFLDSPARRYRVIVAYRSGAVAGYLAYCVAEGHSHVSVHLAELVCAPDDGAHDTLLLELISRARGLHAHAIATLAIPATRGYRGLTRAGFFGGPQFSVQLVPLHATPALEALRARARWFMSGADFDVI